MLGCYLIVALPLLVVAGAAFSIFEIVILVQGGFTVKRENYEAKNIKHTACSIYGDMLHTADSICRYDYN